MKGEVSIQVMTTLARFARKILKRRHWDLHRAAARNKPWVARVLLAAGDNPNEPHTAGDTALHIDAGDTALHIAANNGYAGVGELLLEAGAEVSAIDADGWQAIHRAVTSVEFTKLLVRYGADVTVKLTNGSAAIHVACGPMGYSSIDYVRYLLINGEKLDVRDSGGATPLHHAAGYGHAEMCRFLLSRGANVDSWDDDGRAPIDWADHNDVIEVLLAHGAEVFARTKGKVSRLRGPQRIGDEARTPLHRAAADNDVSSAKMLVSSGGRDARDSERGYSPLHTAAEAGSIEVAEVLLSVGADPESRADDGSTPLHIAAQHGRFEIAKSLMAHGANPALLDASGKTPADLGEGDLANLLRPDLGSIFRSVTRGVRFRRR